MKIFVVTEGEFNYQATVLGVFSTRENALIQVEKAMKNYWIMDGIEWKQKENDTWVYGMDYIEINVYELDEDDSPR